MTKSSWIGLLAAPLVAVSVFSAENDDALLYCDYDGKADATFSVGDGTATHAVEPEFREGVSGQALVIGGKPSDKQEIVDGIPVVKGKGRNCYYSPEKNFDIDNGSISFWLKPLDWDGSTKGFNVFFHTRAGENFFQIYKFFSGQHVNFIRGYPKSRCKVEIGNWRPGEWRHVVATWSPMEVKLFIDGRIVCRRPVKFPLKKFSKIKPLSVGPGNAWDKAFIGESLIDEFRIHAKPLSSEEVVALYQRHADKVRKDVGLINIGSKTPKLDGTIGDFEYSFAGTGFSNPKTGMISLKQSHYFLSYDKDNFYLGFKSALSEKAKKDDGDRVELFLDDGGEKPSRLTFATDGTVNVAGGAVTTDGITSKSVVKDDAWTLEAAIPFKALGADSAPVGEDWRINVGAVFTDPPVVTSAAPVIGDLSDSGDFITLAFRENVPSIRIAGLFDLEKHESVSDISVEPGKPNADIVMIHTKDTTYKYGLRTFTHPLHVDGKSTPFRAPLPPRKPWKLPDFALNDIKIVEKVDGESTLLYHGVFVYEEQTPMATNYLYVKDRKRLFISALRRADGKIRARFLRPDGSLAWSTEKEIPKGVNYFNVEFDLDYSKLSPGLYWIKIDHVAPDGTATETWKQECRIPSVDSPILKKYVDPEAGTVPKPWTPLKADGAVVETWGRQYDFSKGVLFSSLKSQNNELLAAPASLRLNGETLALKDEPVPVLISANDMKSLMEKNANLGEFVVSSRIVTHFDGYCAIEMTVDPRGKEGKINTLSLDVPLKGDVAELVRDNIINKLGGGKSGAVNDYWCQKMGANPYFWVGNEKVGFNWLAPSLDAWHVKNHEKDVEIIRNGDVATMRFNFVDHPLTLTEPRTFKFGFTLTPTKPLNEKILRKRIGVDWEKWCQPWHYFSVLDYETANRDKIKKRSRDVDEIFLYLGVGLTSPFAPDWTFWEEEWRGDGPNVEYGRWTGIYPRAYTSGDIDSDTFRNFLNHMRAEFFEKAKTPLTPKAVNYYFDTGAGAPRKIDHIRELALNVYRMIRRTGPNAKIISHQGWRRMMPSQHFTDVIIGGEGVESVLSVSNTGSYYDVLTPEMFRATFLPQIWGMKTAFLNMLVRAAALSPAKVAGFAEDPKAQRATRHYYGYCVVHDVDSWDSHKETAEVRGIVRKAQDQMGWDTDIVFHPYWEKDSGVTLVSPKSDRILASAYSKDGKLMLAVLNDTDETQDVKLSLDLAKLGVKPGQTGNDAFVKNKNYVLGESWEDSIPPLEFRLIVWPK